MKLYFLLLVLVLSPLASAYGVTFYSPEQSEHYGKVYDVLESEKLYSFSNKNAAVAITQLSFRLNRDAENGGITIYNLNNQPKNTPEIADAFEFIELKYTGFVPHDTSRMDYGFKIAKPFFDTVTYKPADVALFVFREDIVSWVALPTLKTSEDDDYVYYTAFDKGVHYLYIGRNDGLVGSKDVTSDEIPVESVVSETEPEKTTPTVESAVEKPVGQVVEEPKVEVEEPSVVEEPKVEVKETPVVVEEKSQETKPAVESPKILNLGSTTVQETKPVKASPIVFVVMLAIIVSIVVLYFVFGGQKQSQVDKELHTYIKESLKRGRTHEDVKKRLAEVGWQHDRIDAALAKHKK
jgi:PGF-pre-PGF domain-containing protein